MVWVEVVLNLTLTPFVLPTQRKAVPSVFLRRRRRRLRVALDGGGRITLLTQQNPHRDDSQGQGEHG